MALPPPIPLPDATPHGGDLSPPPTGPQTAPQTAPLRPQGDTGTLFFEEMQAPALPSPPPPPDTRLRDSGGGPGGTLPSPAPMPRQQQSSAPGPTQAPPVQAPAHMMRAANRVGGVDPDSFDNDPIVNVGVDSHTKMSYWPAKGLQKALNEAQKAGVPTPQFTPLQSTRTKGEQAGLHSSKGNLASPAGDTKDTGSLHQFGFAIDVGVPGNWRGSPEEYYARMDPIMERFGFARPFADNPQEDHHYAFQPALKSTDPERVWKDGDRRMEAWATNIGVPDIGSIDDIIVNSAFSRGFGPKSASVFDRLLLQESGRRTHDESGNLITSPAGAVGIGQIMPGTLQGYLRDRGLSAKDYADSPHIQIDIAAEHFKKLVDSYDGNMAKALAAYNGGHGAVEWAETRGPYPASSASYAWSNETLPYVAKILGVPEADAMHWISSKETPPADSPYKADGKPHWFHKKSLQDDAAAWIQQTGLGSGNPPPDLLDPMPPLVREILEVHTQPLSPQTQSDLDIGIREYVKGLTSQAFTIVAQELAGADTTDPSLMSYVPGSPHPTSMALNAAIGIRDEMAGTTGRGSGLQRLIAGVQRFGGPKGETLAAPFQAIADYLEPDKTSHKPIREWIKSKRGGFDSFGEWVSNIPIAKSQGGADFDLDSVAGNAAALGMELPYLLGSVAGAILLGPEKGLLSRQSMRGAREAMEAPGKLLQDWVRKPNAYQALQKYGLDWQAKVQAKTQGNLARQGISRITDQLPNIFTYAWIGAGQAGAEGYAESLRAGSSPREAVANGMASMFLGGLLGAAIPLAIPVGGAAKTAGINAGVRKVADALGRPIPTDVPWKDFAAKSILDLISQVDDALTRPGELGGPFTRRMVERFTKMHHELARGPAIAAHTRRVAEDLRGIASNYRETASTIRDQFQVHQDHVSGLEESLARARSSAQKFLDPEDASTLPMRAAGDKHADVLDGLNKIKRDIDNLPGMDPNARLQWAQENAEFVEASGAKNIDEFLAVTGKDGKSKGLKHLETQMQAAQKEIREAGLTTGEVNAYRKARNLVQVAQEKLELAKQSPLFEPVADNPGTMPKPRALHTADVLEHMSNLLEQRAALTELGPDMTKARPLTPDDLKHLEMDPNFQTMDTEMLEANLKAYNDSLDRLIDSGVYFGDVMDPVAFEATRTTRAILESKGILPQDVIAANRKALEDLAVATQVEVDQVRNNVSQAKSTIKRIEKAGTPERVSAREQAALDKIQNKVVNRQEKIAKIDAETQTLQKDNEAAMYETLLGAGEFLGDDIALELVEKVANDPAKGAEELIASLQALSSDMGRALRAAKSVRAGVERRQAKAADLAQNIDEITQARDLAEADSEASALISAERLALRGRRNFLNLLRKPATPEDTRVEGKVASAFVETGVKTLRRHGSKAKLKPEEVRKEALDELLKKEEAKWWKEEEELMEILAQKGGVVDMISEVEAERAAVQTTIEATRRFRDTTKRLGTLEGRKERYLGEIKEAQDSTQGVLTELRNREAALQRGRAEKIGELEAQITKDEEFLGRLESTSAGVADATERFASAEQQLVVAQPATRPDDPLMADLGSPDLATAMGARRARDYVGTSREWGIKTTNPLQDAVDKVQNASPEERTALYARELLALTETWADILMPSRVGLRETSGQANPWDLEAPNVTRSVQGMERFLPQEVTQATYHLRTHEMDQSALARGNPLTAVQPDTAKGLVDGLQGFLVANTPTSLQEAFNRGVNTWKTLTHQTNHARAVGGRVREGWQQMVEHLPDHLTVGRGSSKILRPEVAESMVDAIESMVDGPGAMRKFLHENPELRKPMQLFLGVARALEGYKISSPELRSMFRDGYVSHMYPRMQKLRAAGFKITARELKTVLGSEGRRSIDTLADARAAYQAGSGELMGFAGWKKSEPTSVVGREDLFIGASSSERARIMGMPYDSPADRAKADKQARYLITRLALKDPVVDPGVAMQNMIESTMNVSAVRNALTNVAQIRVPAMKAHGDGSIPLRALEHTPDTPPKVPVKGGGEEHMLRLTDIDGLNIGPNDVVIFGGQEYRAAELSMHPDFARVFADRFAANVSRSDAQRGAEAFNEVMRTVGLTGTPMFHAWNILSGHWTTLAVNAWSSMWEGAAKAGRATFSGDEAARSEGVKLLGQSLKDFFYSPADALGMGVLGNKALTGNLPTVNPQVLVSDAVLHGLNLNMFNATLRQATDAAINMAGREDPVLGQELKRGFWERATTKEAPGERWEKSVGAEGLLGGMADIAASEGGTLSKVGQGAKALAEAGVKGGVNLDYALNAHMVYEPMKQAALAAYAIQSALHWRRIGPKLLETLDPHQAIKMVKEESARYVNTRTGVLQHYQKINSGIPGLDVDSMLYGTAGGPGGKVNPLSILFNAATPGWLRSKVDFISNGLPARLGGGKRLEDIVSPELREYMHKEWKKQLMLGAAGTVMAQQFLQFAVSGGTLGIMGAALNPIGKPFSEEHWNQVRNELENPRLLSDIQLADGLSLKSPFYGQLRDFVNLTQGSAVDPSKITDMVMNNMSKPGQVALETLVGRDLHTGRPFRLGDSSLPGTGGSLQWVSDTASHAGRRMFDTINREVLQRDMGAGKGQRPIGLGRVALGLMGLSVQDSHPMLHTDREIAAAETFWHGRTKETAERAYIRYLDTQDVTHLEDAVETLAKGVPTTGKATRWEMVFPGGRAPVGDVEGTLQGFALKYRDHPTYNLTLRSEEVQATILRESRKWTEWQIDNLLPKILESADNPPETESEDE